jgi:hypothetical protein
MDDPEDLVERQSGGVGSGPPRQPLGLGVHGTNAAPLIGDQNAIPDAR